MRAVLQVPLLVSIAAAKAPAITHAAACRSPLSWPFNATSIWNTLVGSGATFALTGLFPIDGSNRSAFFNLGVDEMSFLVTTNDDPVVPWYSQGHWGQPKTAAAYCTVTGPLAGHVHMPSTYTSTDFGGNNAVSILLPPPNATTVFTVQPTYVCEPGAPLLALKPAAGQEFVDIVSESGALGGHGGSGLSALGGVLRLGEMLPDAPPIHHVLQLEFFAHLFYYLPPDGNKSECFSWPAVQCDGYCFAPCTENAGCYGGTLPAMRPGALLAVPSDAAPAVAAALTTQPAHRLLAALVTYGALAVDDTYWNATGITAEKGVADEFLAAYGFPFSVNANNAAAREWYNDVLALFRALRVVTNNAPDSPGGGGVPLAPPPPPFCAAGVAEEDSPVLGLQPVPRSAPRPANPPAPRSPSPLARTPPMGWMSWQTFRCQTNCTAYPDACINEALYRAQADALVDGGYAAAGYTGVHLDDCIVSGRDPVTHELVADASRFPSGFSALGSYLHGKGLTFGMYTAEGTSTCSGLPGSRGYEDVDAAAFVEWGVDYLKADGCGDPAYYDEGYKRMGAALKASGRDIVFSCSWPAYLGDNEAAKPFATMIADGCSLWRNYIDVTCTIGYLQGIIEHWGNYSAVLAQWAQPGAWHDPDQLLVGNDCISDDAARTQMAIYAIVAAPLILGIDLRHVTPSQRDILLNRGALAVNQDALGRMGIRLGGAAAANAPQQVWMRPLEGGDVAVALYNAGQPAAHPWHTACDANATTTTTGGYHAPAGPTPVSWCVNDFSLSLLDWYCCNTRDCAGYNFSATTNSGCMFRDVDGGFVAAEGVTGVTKNGFAAPTGESASISFTFADVGLFPGSAVRVTDLWTGESVVTNATSWTADAVPWQGTALLRLSPVGSSGDW